jgi:hypothetical protein
MRHADLRIQIEQVKQEMQTPFSFTVELKNKACAY